MERKKLLIAGGDMRMLYAASKLSDIYDVELIGYSEEKLPADGLEIFRKFKETKEKTDILVLPPVVTDSSGRINSPLGKISPEIKDIINNLKNDSIVLMGIKGKIATEYTEKMNLHIYNYMEDETLALANAIPTAEAALKIAMEETGRTIWGSRVLVTGFGRIGTILTDRLIKLGADVTAAARKEYDRMKIKAMGAKSANILPNQTDLADMDIIFNTVPAEIFGKEQLMSLKKECVFIDLASAPGGIDKSIASEMDLKYVWATGLPRSDMC